MKNKNHGCLFCLLKKFEIFYKDRAIKCKKFGTMENAIVNEIRI